MGTEKSRSLAHLICFGDRSFAFQFLDSRKQTSDLNQLELHAALIAVLAVARQLANDETEPLPPLDGMLCAAEVLAGLAMAMHEEHGQGMSL
jgi:hypothetical protein